jgi:signal transduction histidine kinase
MALDNERLADEARARLDEVQASRQRIVEAGEQERRRLERDLHDGAQQQLVAMALGLRMLQQRAGRSGDIVLADGLDSLAADLDSALTDIRELARGIRPPVLAEGGLGPALEALAERAPMAVATDVRVSGRLPDAVESTLYFVVSEALANVLKHAGASHVTVAAEETGGAIVLCVRDDGCGGAATGAGTGLRGLADRLDALGGSLAVDSPPGGGTALRATVPLRDTAQVRPSPSPAGT